MPLPDINELARSIARADAEDPDQREEIARRLGELKACVDEHFSPDGRLRLDSALLLISHLELIGEEGGDEVLRIVSRLVASLESCFVQEGERPAPGPLPREDGDREVGLIEDMLLGEILVQFGTINSDQVGEALELQRTSGMRFGDALVAIGAANRTDVQAAVVYQERLHNERKREASPLPSAALPAFRPVSTELKLVSDMLLGNLLVRMGRISPDQLQEGLRAHRASGKRIGEALVELGIVSWKDVEEALRIQRERRVSRV